jgi:hypothetical protein
MEAIVVHGYSGPEVLQFEVEGFSVGEQVFAMADDTYAVAGYGNQSGPDGYGRRSGGRCRSFGGIHREGTRKLIIPISQKLPLRDTAEAQAEAEAEAEAEKGGIVAGGLTLFCEQRTERKIGNEKGIGVIDERRTNRAEEL